MMQIEKPRVEVIEKENGSVTKFVVEPLERGFGITLGNCLRRTLLGSMPGAAAVAIKIDGIQHEFSSIPGVTEDVTDIVLNIKNLAVKTSVLDEDFTTTLYLHKKGAGVVTAQDIEVNDQVEILNPDLKICTLDDNAKLDMEIIIGRGRGYVPAQKNKKEEYPIGTIAIDSIFTPVKAVNYSVESTRVGQSIDYDKLTLDVTTNGTMSAKEIISLAAKIVQEHLGLGADVDAAGGLVHQQHRGLGHQALGDDHLLLVAAGEGQYRQVLVRHLDVQILDLRVHGLLLGGIVHQKPGQKVGQRSQGGVLADVQALHKALPLPVLGHQREAGVELVRHIADPHGLALIDHLAGMLGPHAHQALEELAAARAQQAVDAQHLALL